VDRQLIIKCDDFGRYPAINAGVVRGIAEGRGDGGPNER
jgi:hypothetical protein